MYTELTFTTPWKLTGAHTSENVTRNILELHTNFRFPWVQCFTSFKDERNTCRLRIFGSQYQKWRCYDPDKDISSQRQILVERQTFPSFVVYPKYNRCKCWGIGVIWHCRIILVALILSKDYLFVLYRVHRLQNLTLPQEIDFVSH
jgi:hypothetical protein